MVIRPLPREAKEQKLWSGPLSLASLDSLFAPSGVGSSLVPENLRQFCPPAPETFTLKEYQVSETAFEGRECFCFLLTQVVQLEAVCPIVYVLEDQRSWSPLYPFCLSPCPILLPSSILDLPSSHS